MNQVIIGKDAEIICLERRYSGVIVDETKNMVHLKTKEGIKKFIKKNIALKIETMRIKGNEITKRPEERIKW